MGQEKVTKNCLTCRLKLLYNRLKLLYKQG